MRSILAIAIVIGLAPLHARAGEPDIRTVHGAVLCTTPFQLRKATVAADRDEAQRGSGELCAFQRDHRPQFTPSHQRAWSWSQAPQHPSPARPARPEFREQPRPKADKDRSGFFAAHLPTKIDDQPARLRKRIQGN